ncbi:hypothetical protein V6N13_105683 [Hibiscus sabdariffa]|uniref:Uncharacterized protein n=1 Tax=Hibiscus sabdariffa TaxID=183260 RepID=A0ABR2EYE8_9ROSI
MELTEIERKVPLNELRPMSGCDRARIGELLMLCLKWTISQLLTVLLRTITIMIRLAFSRVSKACRRGNGKLMLFVFYVKAYPVHNIRIRRPLDFLIASLKALSVLFSSVIAMELGSVDKSIYVPAAAGVFFGKD